MTRQLPGGYGQRKGEDSAIGNAESQFFRESLITPEDGWILTTLGDMASGHADVTGAALAQDRLTLYYIPERAATISASEVRINVPIAVASTMVEVSLFAYKSNFFKRVPGTYYSFDTSSIGLKKRTLDRTIALTPDMRLFLGIVGHNGTPILEGFQSGAGISPRIVASLYVSNVPSMGSVYSFSTFTKSNDNADIPMVAYLAKEAAYVL